MYIYSAHCAEEELLHIREEMVCFVFVRSFSVIDALTHTHTHTHTYTYTHTHTHKLYAQILCTTPLRGVIVVSIVFGGGEVCIAYTLVLVNLWDPKHVLRYFYEYCCVD